MSKTEPNKTASAQSELNDRLAAPVNSAHSKKVNRYDANRDCHGCY